MSGKSRIKMSLPKSFQVRNLNVWPQKMKNLSQSSSRKMQPTKRNDFEPANILPTQSKAFEYSSNWKWRKVNRYQTKSMYIFITQFSTWNKWKFPGFTTIFQYFYFTTISIILQDAVFDIAFMFHCLFDFSDEKFNFQQIECILQDFLWVFKRLTLHFVL